MPTRYHAQRQHLVQSLDSLVHQLFTLSFLMSPSIVVYLIRMFVQMQCARPREFDPTYHIRFFYGLILSSSATIMWMHGAQGPSQGRTLIIDFVGLSYVPSKLQLLCLDFLIIFLQLVIMIISYETQLYYTSTQTDIPDVLLPDTPSYNSDHYAPLLPQSTSTDTDTDTDTDTHNVIKDARDSTPCIVNLQLSPVVMRLRHPIPPVSTRTDPLLPLPNTTSLPLPHGLQMLMRVTARARQDRGAAARNDITDQARDNRRNGLFPGGLA